MAKTKKCFTTFGREISAEVAEQLITQTLRIKAAVSADHLWKRILTAAERKQLGGNLEKCWRKLGTAGMWRKLRGGSAERAVIEVALELGFLDDRTAKWLLREIGEETLPPPVVAHPVWHAERGELRWGDQVIRRVRVLARRSTIQRLLEAFQAAEWPPRIDDPICQGEDADQLRQIVLGLNQGLEVLRFHVQEGGRAITWSRP